MENPDFRMYPNLYNVVTMKGQHSPALLRDAHRPLRAAEGVVERSEESFEKIEHPHVHRLRLVRLHVQDAPAGRADVLAPPPERRRRSSLFTGPAHLERPFHGFHDEILRWYDHWLKGMDTGRPGRAARALLGHGRQRVAHGRRTGRCPRRSGRSSTSTSWERLRPSRSRPARSTTSSRPTRSPRCRSRRRRKVAAAALPDRAAAARRADRRPLGAQAVRGDRPGRHELDRRPQGRRPGPVGAHRPRGRARAARRPARARAHPRLAQGVQPRARPRALDTVEAVPQAHPRGRRQPVVPGEVTEYEIEILATANLFRAGHRICVEITSVDGPTGVAGATNVEYVPYHVCSSQHDPAHVYHDTAAPSHLLLPVIPGGDPRMTPRPAAAVPRRPRRQPPAPGRAARARARPTRPGEITPTSCAPPRTPRSPTPCACSATVGLRSVTDGEFRRASWQMDFIYALGGRRALAGAHRRRRSTTRGGTITFRPSPARRHRVDRRGADHLRRGLPGAAAHRRRDGTPKLTIPSPSMVHYGARPRRRSTRRSTPTSTRSGTTSAPPTRRRSAASASSAARTCSSTTRASPTSTTRPSASSSRRSAATRSASTSATSRRSTAPWRAARRAWRSRRTSAAATSGPPGTPRAATSTSPRRCSAGWRSTASSSSTTTSAPAASSRCASCPQGKAGRARARHDEDRALERKDDLKRRIEEASRHLDVDQLCLSPQCGFASTRRGQRPDLRRPDGEAAPRRRGGRGGLGEA